MPRAILVTSLVVLAAFAVASLARAQGLSALKEHDINQPVDIEADRSELFGRDDAALYIGNVHVAQGQLDLFSERLHVFYSLPEGAANPEVHRLDATGNVRLESPSENASSDWGVYDVTERLITLGGNVVLTRGDSRLEGERLEIDLETGVAKLDGKTTENRSGRVRGRFVLPEKNDEDPGDDGG